MQSTNTRDRSPSPAALIRPYSGDALFAHLNAPARIQSNAVIADVGDSPAKEISRASLISTEFIKKSLFNGILVLKVHALPMRRPLPKYLLDAYKSTDGSRIVRDLPINLVDIKNILEIYEGGFHCIEFYNLPSAFWRVAFDFAFQDFIGENMRFIHWVDATTLTVLEYMPRAIPVMPVIYEDRTQAAPQFYSHLNQYFPSAAGETYVFLPRLFLDTKCTGCKDAAFRVLTVTADSIKTADDMRPVFSMPMKPEAKHYVHDIFHCDMLTYYVDSCEGLNFGVGERFRDPKTGIEHQYAFKLSEKKVRLMIMVKCSVHGRWLVDRAIQTARLYYAMLSELTTLEEFHIVVLINVQRDVLAAVYPFALSDIQVGFLTDGSKDTVQPVHDLKTERPDLDWFTRMCTPLSVYRVYDVDYSTMKRCLWIVDVNPERPQQH